MGANIVRSHTSSHKMPRLWFSRLILPTLLATPALADVVNLASLTWTLTNSNGTLNIPSTGPPNQAHIDLLNAGIITEPLLGINGTNHSNSFHSNIFISDLLIDFTQRWVVDENWTYTADITPFLKSSAFRQSKKTLLVFYGIDTIANIVRSRTAYLGPVLRHILSRPSQASRSHGSTINSVNMSSMSRIYSRPPRVLNLS